ncbi:hypothetical protein [Nocardia sp. NPDC047038]|uniref:hypothetical protein n=1 Tax=Nocardia sp. NPDC047038 TaxID=3154338 RepID=UPI0033FECEAF
MSISLLSPPATRRVFDDGIMGLPVTVFRPALADRGAISLCTAKPRLFVVGIADTRGDLPLQEIDAWQQEPVFDGRSSAVVVHIRQRKGNIHPEVSLEAVTLTLTGITRRSHCVFTGAYAGTEHYAFTEVLEKILGYPVAGPLPIRAPVGSSY